MYESLSLTNKIRWAEDRLESSRKSFKFWSDKESELRSKYGSNPTSLECLHIKKIKQYRKESKSNIEYWSLELNKCKNKQFTYILFS